MKLTLPNSVLDLSAPVVMGVLNVTPDSFSDGGRFLSPDDALSQVEKMVTEGAAFIDIGGESTRPGAAPVTVSQELDRVCPLVEAVRARFDVNISVDTSTPEVMRESVVLGADLINDVRALSREGALEAAASSGAAICLMHMKGEPGAMQDNPTYTDIVKEVSSYLGERRSVALEAGIDIDRIMLDPGFGFGKTLEHNLVLMKHLQVFVDMGSPVLVGVSRKSMLGMITGKAVEERLIASVSAAAVAIYNGARIIRAHDVGATVDAIKVAAAIRGV
ncbi:dihydropteroate synthase [Hahella chejuensis KCTC 2396]|uniref:Dihydropteroate synthase n=1 Tax=Hahella chejuensis (strain KCTC 2396) TaxID=349521 RepID=Q2SML9_HAHCH|nr:dihydropteroate synthase [Hahella chejuensis]ABC28105.1 dihydropteroate synthase [Hahella chejuensis KCTC 2396]